MASILRVNTLTDASSNNSTAMSTINQGTAKAWADFTGVTTTALRDSFNVSGLTDNATGSTSVALSSNMSNANYTGSWFANVSTGTASSNFDNTWTGGFGSRATTGYGVWSYGTTSAASFDSSYNDTIIFGDLA